MLKKKVRLEIEYYVLLCSVALISCIPFKILYFLSDILYYPVYFIFRYRRKVVRKNLTESFPDKSLKEIIRREKGFYHFLIDTTLESCKLISIRPKEMKRRIRFPNIEVTNEKLRTSRYVSVFMGHYGNWEWVSTISLWLYTGTVPVQIYKKLSNSAVDKIMKKLRERWGNVCVDMHQTVRYIANVANDSRPYIIGFIADQSPRKRESKHFIQFLNHNTPVLTGPEKIIKHYGHEAFFLSIRRVKRGYYECELSPLHDAPASLPNFELTSLYYRRLEQEIVDHPEFYLWSHKRFRHATIYQSASE